MLCTRKYTILVTKCELWLIFFGFFPLFYVYCYIYFELFKARMLTKAFSFCSLFRCSHVHTSCLLKNQNKSDFSFMFIFNTLLLFFHNLLCFHEKTYVICNFYKILNLELAPHTFVQFSEYSTKWQRRSQGINRITVIEQQLSLLFHSSRILPTTLLDL